MWMVLWRHILKAECATVFYVYYGIQHFVNGESSQLGESKYREKIQVLVI
jgi:hypothetical protein